MPKSVENLGQRLKEITVDLKRYIETKVELLVLNIGSKIARWIARSIQQIFGIILMIVAAIFLLVALALYLGIVLGSPSLGFAIVALPVLLGGYLLFKLKPRKFSRKLKLSFENELMDALKIGNTEEQNEKLMASEKAESLNKNEHHAGNKQRNPQE